MFLTQLTLGSYSAEFLNDESSHYISSLLLHDYVLAGFPNPLTYLTGYHSHYPLVGIGAWGPAFYGIEAVWMLFASDGRTSVIVFSGVVTVTTVLLLYAFARPVLGPWISLLVCVLFLIVPFVQEGAGQLMLDMPIALFCFAATVFYVRYLETGRSAYVVLFALIAASAMLTKGTGACLALVPPAAVLIGRRFDLLRKFSFWLPLPIVALLTMPWYALTFERSSAGFRYGFGIDYAATAITANADFLWNAAGPLVIITALVGFADVVRRGRACDPRLTGAVSLAVAVWLFQSIVPAAIQARYLIPILPPLFLLAGWGLCVVAMWLSVVPQFRLTRKHAEIACAAILALGALPLALRAEHKPHLGFDEAARQVWSQYLASNPSVLIAANNEDEGRAIAELAMLDPQRPSLFAVRGSRLLGGGGYNAFEYEPRFRTPQEVMAEIDAYSIPYVLLRRDPNPNAWQHIAQVEAARDLSPERWQLIDRSGSAGNEILLYRIRGNSEKRGDVVKLLTLSAPRALQN